MSKNSMPGVPGQETNPSTTTKPAIEPDILEEIAKVDASVLEAMPAVERAAFRRELLSAIRRATWAAERLADIAEGEEEPASNEPEDDEDEGPITQRERPYRRSLALLSDGAWRCRWPSSKARISAATSAGRASSSSRIKLSRRSTAWATLRPMSLATSAARSSGRRRTATMATSKVARAFGREVRRRRHAQGLTLDALSAGAGLTPNFIGEIEAGKRDPSITMVAKIAAGLGAPLGELLGLPDLMGDSIEAARLLSKLPRDVRETIVEALRALAIWAERRRP